MQVLKAMTAQLESILVVNGYQHDLAGQVARGRRNRGVDSFPPYLDIFEVRPEDMPDVAGDTIQKDSWILGIQGTVKSDDLHPTDPAHALLADIKKSLGAIMSAGDPGDRNPLYMFGNLISDLICDGGICFVPSEAPEVALCVMKVVINLTEDLENPYE